MAALFVDLDGTTFQFGTNTFLPGALEHLRSLVTAGHQIIFVTRRPSQTNPGLKEFLQKQIGAQVMLIMSVSSPRVLIDDSAVVCVNHQSNMPWDYDFSSLGKG
jgi:ribonucleotide monophosphatase NagD (HAD superfamily)